MAETISLLLLGFLFGFKHALEADHIAAVSSLSSSAEKRFDFLRAGIWWGIGHTAVLLGVGMLLFIFGVQVPPEFAIFFERIVSIALIMFGGYQIFLFWKNRKKIPEQNIVIHDHPPIGVHIHHAPSFFMGVLHGLAGSGAVLLLVLSMFSSSLFALFYLLLFGIGSIFGMMTVGIALKFSSRLLKNHLPAVTGLFSVVAGLTFFWI